MKHLGDIAKVHGGDIAPVDVITFGSPGQDLSVAGGQKGMKYVCPACGVEFAITAGAASCPMCGTEIEPYPIAVTAWNFGGRAQVLLGGVHRNE